MPVKKVLVVDDSPTERHVLVELLTKNGYQVITAESGEEGIEKAKSELPDLVLMDVVMPGLNGYQATRTLTRDEATKHIPIIVCTSKGQETDKIWGLRQGALDYLVKPVNGEELLSKIAALSPPAFVWLSEAVFENFRRTWRRGWPVSATRVRQVCLGFRPAMTSGCSI